METVGSISREIATQKFPFLSTFFKGRRKAIKEFTHQAPDFVFWIYPNGKLLDAKDAHKKNPPPGHEYILDDEPDYGGFLRGRLASNFSNPLLVVYCRSEALANKGPKLNQLLKGIEMMPIPINDSTLVISDNGDIYGTISDLYRRQND